MRTHRLFALIVVLSLLAACSAPPTPTPDAPLAAAQATAAIEAGGLVVKHVLGEIILPKPVERVVVLEWTYVEDVLAVGVQPVGVADITGYHDWVSIPVELSEDAVDVGMRNEPNLETITRLQPDLIITTMYDASNNYDALKAIAPTLVFDAYPADEGSQTRYEEMRDTQMTIAYALGRVPEGEAVLAHMEQTFADSKARIEAAGLTGEKFVLAQGSAWGPIAQVRLFTNNSMSVQIVEQIGLDNAWDGADTPYGFDELSVETLKDLGDVNFFYVVPNEGVLEEYNVRPVWDTLEFVKNGHAYWLGGDTWLFGGPLSAERLVTVITDYLVD